jgi:hypothetical protein
VRTLVAAAHTILQERQLATPHPLLAQLEDHLHAEADVVITAKQVLAEKLHRALAQETLPDRRLTATLLHDIRAAGRQAAAAPPLARPFILLETDAAALHLPLARPPQFEQPRPTTCAVPEIPAPGAPPSLPDLLAEDVPPVDLARLAQQLATLLAQGATAALAEVVARYGLPQGLPELVAYLNGDAGYPVHVDPLAPPDLLALPDARRVQVPRVYFTQCIHRLERALGRRKSQAGLYRAGRSHCLPVWGHAARPPPAILPLRGD